MDHPRQPHDRNVRLLKNDTLGSGSYGVVCKAMWGQRLCAAKLLHPIFFHSNDPGFVTTRRRFEQECRFLNDMKHPHIVEYLGTSHYPDSGLLVLLMELMDESLTHFLERSQQALAFHIEVDLCHDIAQALVYIHSKDIIHRDLSGNNVLLLAGRAKITDFGQSKLFDANRRMTPLTMCPGTLAYMPPEALREPPVYSKKIDCFSFGVLQIQIMTRQFPDPGPAMRVVEDSRSPTGTMNMPVLDSERRKSHIDLINPAHTLLPTALDCLSYSEKDRPSAQDLCRQLAAVKEAPRYQLQILQWELQDSQRRTHTLQRELQTKDQQLQDCQRRTHTLQQDLQDSQRCTRNLQQELQDSQRRTHTLQQDLQDSQRRTHSLQQELQTKDQQLQDSQRQIQQLTHQVEEKQHTNNDKETLLRELNQQLQSNEQVTAEFQQNLLQHEQTNRQLQDTVGQLRRDLQQAKEEKQAPRYKLQILQRELQDSQRRTHSLQQELQDSQRQIQQLTHQVEEKQYTIGDKETLLRVFQRILLQHEQTNRQLQDTVDRLRQDLQQAVEEKQAGERRLREDNQQLPIMPQVGARPRETTTPPRPELQQPQEKQHAAGNGQLQRMKRPGPLPQKTVTQQKAIKDMGWQREPKAPQKMRRGSAAVDANIAYFNWQGLTTVHSYDSDAQEWHRLPDAPHTQSTLVVVHHILTMVGGEISDRATDSLLSLMGEGRDKKWLPNLPAMPTKRYDTAAVCSGRSLIIAGGEDDSNRLATVEVLDTDARQWSIASSLTRPLTEATISICGERLYMLGGYDQTGHYLGTRSVLSCSIPELLQSCQTPSLRRRVAQKLKSTIWRQVADAPHYLSSCATLCGQLVAVGGYKAGYTSAISVYNETTDSWEAMGNMPTARCLALVAILNGKMMVVGGLVRGLSTTTDVVEILY